MMKLICVTIVVCAIVVGCASKKIVAKNCREIENAYFECEEP